MTYYTYEFVVHPQIVRWPWTFREVWSEDEFEEAWRGLNARGYEMHEAVRYRSNVLMGWPKPVVVAENAEDTHRARHPNDVGALLAWLRSEPLPAPARGETGGAGA